MTEKELLDLKEEMNDAKQDLATLNGEKQGLIRQLKTDWDCSSVADARKKVQEMEEELAEIEQDLKTGTAELEKLLEDAEN